ncbi:hypothetical protein TELCIR_15669 [Teladorsagia circumcincta]|uniref:Glucuronosyltransferase n=1 Tax=Teladorsagia circumcincta TaxID=45464 RepID=A0A2G9TXJ0_TELCI|nr:hypothetical protein TELCIR_15669 [Teladorsagia circumcincta]
MASGLYGLILLATVCSSYKIVLFAPDISNSQVGWNKRVSESLARAGHDVTVVLVQTIEGADKDISFGSEVKITVQNKKFMKWLTDEKFDIGFAHMYHTCPIALIHAAKIPTWIWLLSGAIDINHHCTQLNRMQMSNGFYTDAEDVAYP